MATYKSSFADGEAVDAALTVAANIDATREGIGTKFLRDDLTWEEPPGSGSVTYGTTAGTACEGNDSRLSDARTAIAHEATHQDGGSDEIDILTLGGFTAGTTRFLREDGSYQEVSGGGGTTVINSDAALGITIGVTDSGAAYECDGNDDHVQFQAAINAASSGDKIIVLDGDYSFASQVSETDKNLTIEANGQVTITLSTGSSFGFYFAGTAGASPTALSSSAAAGANSIVVSSATGFAAGHNVIISDNNDWTADTEYTGLKTGEMHEIWYIDGTTLYLRDTLQRSYTTGNSATAKSFAPISIKFEGISFVGPGAVGTQLGIGVRYGNVVRIEKCTFRNCGGAGICLYTCYDSKVEKCTIRDSNQSGLGYGIGLFDACAKSALSKNVISGCRHCISITSTQAQPGMNRDIIIDKNTLYGAQSGVIDSHPNLINWKVTDNIIYQSGVQAIADGSQIAIITGNEIYGEGIRPRDEINNPRNKIISNNIVHDGFLFYDVQKGAYDSLTITDNQASGGASTQIYIYYGAASKDAKSIKIQGNTLEGSGNRAIDIGLESQTFPCCLDISGNTIRDCTTEGMYIYVNAGMDNDVIVNGNTIRGANAGNGGDAALRLYNVVGGVINGNKIKDPRSYSGGGIIASTGCSDNNVVGNTVTGMGTPVSLAGSNNVNEHNKTSIGA